MGALSPILRSCWDNHVGFWCPGCKGAHVIPVDTGPKREGAWTYNGNPDSPTFTPSILVTYNGRDAGIDDAPPSVCHSFVTDGQIRFLADCTHALAGQTVPIPAWPSDYDDGSEG